MRASVGVLLCALLLTAAGCSSGDDFSLEGESCESTKDCKAGLNLVCRAGKCVQDDSGPNQLTLHVVGMGSIKIKNRTTCSSAQCVEGFGASFSAMLTAEAASGWTFTGWSGDCTGTSPAISVAMTGAKECTASFRDSAAPTFMVTVGAQTGGSVAGTGLTCTAGTCTGSISRGATVTLTATPAAGYRFLAWSGSDGCEGDVSPLTVTVAGEVECMASFVQVFPVRVSATGGTAAVTVTAGSCVATECQADKGSDVVFTAPPVAGLRFDEWHGDAACAGKTPTLTVRVNEAISCVATYVKRFTVAGVIGGGMTGTIVASSTSTSMCSGASCVADEGVAVTLVASTIPGFRVSAWTGAGCDAGVISGNGITIRPTADTTCTAVYTPGVAVGGTVVGAEGTVDARATGNGVNCGTPGQCSLDAGGTVTLTAPNLEPDFRFTGWSGDTGCTGSNRELVFSNVQTSVSCNAGYVRRLEVTAAIEPGHGSATVEIRSDAPFKVCAGLTCTVDEKSPVILTAPVLDGQRLVRWVGVGCEGKTDHIITIAPEGDDVTCTADYVAGVTVIGNIAGATGGAVAAESTSDGHSCAGNRCTFDTGGAVTLTAPDLSPGFRFVGWSGDAGCSGATRAITLGDVTSDRTCVAGYVKRVTVTTGVAVEGGSVALDPADPTADCSTPGKCVVDEGSSISLDVTPPAGYRFDRWSGGAACADKTDDPLVLAAAEVTCTALFVQQFTVTVAASGTTAPVTVTFGACSGSSCAVDAGATARLAVTDSPTDSFRFKEWDGDCDGTATTIDVVVNGAMTCTAVFVQRFTITAASAPTGAPVALDPEDDANSDCDTDSCVTDAASKVTLTAGVLAGKAFSSWTGCTGTQQGSAITVTVNSDLTCTANYVDGVSVSGTISGTEGNGMITATADPAASAVCGVGRCTFPPNMGVDVTLGRPDLLPDYRFVGWSGHASCTGTGTSVTLADVSTSVSCVATYVKRVTVTGASNPAGATMAVTSSGVTCSGASCTMDLSSTANVAITVPTGRRLVSWSGTGCTPITAPPAGTVPNPIVIRATDDITCTANTALTVTVTAAAAGGPTPGPTQTVASTSPGSTCPGPTLTNSCKFDSGGAATLTTQDLTPGYTFVSWGGTGCGSSTSLSTSLSNVTADRTCTATYKQRHRLVAALNILGGGTVATPTISGGTNLVCNTAQSDCRTDTGGAAVTFTAVEPSGFRFKGWSGCSTSTNLAISLTPAADVTCTANYSKQQTVNAATGANGSAKVEMNSGVGTCITAGTQCTGDHDATFKFTATASNNYDFDTWSGTNCSPQTSNPLVPAAAVTTCTASFKKEVYTVAGAVKPVKNPVAGTVQVSYSTCINQPSCSVPFNDTATLVATASSGYQFWKWENCGGSTSASITVNPSANTTCTAMFRIVVQGVTSTGTIAGSPSPAADSTCSGQNTTAATCAVPDGGSIAFTVSNIPTGFTLTGWSGPCTQSPANANAATLNPVSAPAFCSATYFGRWARSYGLEGATEDTVGLLRNGDQIYLVGDTIRRDGESQAPHLTWLPGMTGDVRRSVRLTAGAEQFAGVLASAWGPRGPVIASSGPGSSRSVTELDDRLAPQVSWRLTYTAPIGEPLKLFVTGSGSGPRALGLQGSQLRTGRLQFLQSGEAFDICEDTSLTCAPNGACLTTCSSCSMRNVGPILDVAGESVVAFPGKQDGNLVVVRLKEGTVRWLRRLDFERDLVAPMAIAVNGGELIVVGTVTKANGTLDGFAARLNADSGAAIDAFTYGTAGGNEQFLGVSVDGAGRYLVAGSTTDLESPAGLTDMWLVRTTPDFKTSLQQFAFGGPANDFAVGAVDLPSKDVVLAGNTTSFGSPDDHWAMLLSESLNITFADTRARRRATNADRLITGVSTESPTCFYSRSVGDETPAVNISSEDVGVVVTQQAPGQ